MPIRTFQNLDPKVDKRPLKDVFRWLVTRHPRGDRPEACPACSYPPEPCGVDALRIFWVGHSTLLVEHGSGPRVLIDPVFSDRCSPLRIIGPKRFHPPGIPLVEIPEIDAIVISHNHYDHLDTWSIKELLKRHQTQPVFLVPQGLGMWMSDVGARNVVELGWFENYDGLGWKVTALPAQHWSKRGILATNTSLWCGYRLDYPGGKSLYFAGDSGYFNGFDMIRQQYGPATVAALPIGAYEPQWFMRPIHMNPEEAVRAFQDAGCETFLAIHHNTFRLADEPPDEPARRLRAEWERLGLPKDALWIPAPGEWRAF